MSVIRLLPEALANQIAAGEVVQRPASVVKELLENALDAGASHLQLVIQDAGKTLVQVIDDGDGMSPADARLCFERHATSKIRQVDDLFRIGTYGFRGEALASIAAVAQVTLRTRSATDELGTQVVVAGGSFVAQEQATAPKGSSISVRNLFYNVPARRKFLKGNPVETRHILTEFYRVALVHADKRWTFVHNGETIYDLHPVPMPQRIAELYPFLQPADLLPLSEATSMVGMQGYVARPEAARKSRGEQYFFVNGRFVRDGYLHHAVATAYGDLLAKDCYPVYFLHLEMDPGRVDVNIHPTKTEVKFEDERSVYALLHSTVRQTLGKLHLAQAEQTHTAAAPLESHMPRAWDAALRNDWTATEPSPDATLADYRSNRSNALFEESGGSSARAPQPVPDFANWTPTPPRPAMLAATLPLHMPVPEVQVLQVFQKYLVAALADQLLVIDQAAAHQRVLYEQLLAASAARPLPVQQLLYPIRINYSAADGLLLEPVLPDLRLQGFDAQLIGPGALLISGVPTALRHADAPAMFDNLLAALKQSGAESMGETAGQNRTHDLVARMVARQSAVTIGQRLGAEEATRLVQDLLACREPGLSPAGHPTYCTLPASELAARLDRRLAD